MTSDSHSRSPQLPPEFPRPLDFATLFHFFDIHLSENNEGVEGMQAELTLMADGLPVDRIHIDRWRRLVLKLGESDADDDSVGYSLAHDFLLDLNAGPQFPRIHEIVRDLECNSPDENSRWNEAKKRATDIGVPPLHLR